MQLDGPGHEEVIAHPDVLISHLSVDPNRLGILVGDEVAVLEPAFERCASDRDVHPSVDLATRRLGEPSLLLVGQRGRCGAGGCRAGRHRWLHVVGRRICRCCGRVWCHDHSSNRASNRPNFSRLTTSATANQPRTLLPAEFNFGEKAATASRPGTTASTPPPTPLLAGTPTA